MARFTLSGTPSRLWVTAAVTATLVVLLLGFQWRSARYSPTYYSPPKPHRVTPGQTPGHVDDVAQELPHHPEAPTPPVPSSQPVIPGAQPKVNNELSLEEAGNATLGVAEFIVINFPSRTDKRDRMTLMGAATGLRFTFLPGVDAATVPDAAMPPHAEGWTAKVRGSWRGHMDALRYVVDHDLPSAIILEDDLDWDVRIQSQARNFARATRALLQPLAGRSEEDFADPTYPVVGPKDKEVDPPALSFEDLPETQPPTTSVYGDGWDLLWLGHCGVQQPMGRPPPGEPWAERSGRISRGAVVQLGDASVPQAKDIHSWDDDGHRRFRKDYPAHTRVTHHCLDAVCTFAYAVSQAGARRILFELGLWKMNDPFDLGLRQFCDGIMGHGRHVCLTTQPSLFSHYQHVEGSELDHEKTWNIRWSARENLLKILDGQTDYDDQWPDTLW